MESDKNTILGDESVVAIVVLILVLMESDKNDLLENDVQSGMGS